MANLAHPISKVDRDRSETAPFFSAEVTDARRFYLPPGPKSARKISIVSGGVEHCAPQYRIEREDFPYFGLEFVASGGGMLEIGGRRVELGPGTLFTYGPRIPHRIVARSDTPMVKYFVDFTGRDVKRVMGKLAIAPGTVAQTSAPRELMRLFDDLVQAGARDGKFARPLADALLEAVLYKAAATLTDLGTAGTIAFDTYQRCYRELEANALQINTLTELAERCGVNQAYLCRLFKRFDRQSPYQRLLNLKMHHAAALLHSGGRLVKQVAAELAFENPYHFSRVFKSVMGVPPKRFYTSQRR